MASERNENSADKSTNLHVYSSMRPVTFFTGILLNIIGATMFFCGFFSDRWMTYDLGGKNVKEQDLHKYLANFGPFRACDHSSRCGDLPKVAAGLDKSSTVLVHILLVISATAYIFGLLLMALPIFTKRCANWSLCSDKSSCYKLQARVIPEMVFPLAVVTGFLAMLMLGEVKRKILLRDQQEEAVGSGFILCLFSLVITVAGITCMILNRYVERASTFSKYLSKIKIAKKKKKKVAIQLEFKEPSNPNFKMKVPTTSPTTTGLSVEATLEGDGDNVPKHFQRNEDNVDCMDSLQQCANDATNVEKCEVEGFQNESVLRREEASCTDGSVVVSTDVCRPVGKLFEDPFEDVPEADLKKSDPNPDISNALSDNDRNSALHSRASGRRRNNRLSGGNSRSQGRLDTWTEIPDEMKLPNVSIVTEHETQTRISKLKDQSPE